MLLHAANPLLVLSITVNSTAILVGIGDCWQGVRCQTSETSVKVRVLFGEKITGWAVGIASADSTKPIPTATSTSPSAASTTPSGFHPLTNHHRFVPTFVTTPSVFQATTSSLYGTTGYPFAKNSYVIAEHTQRPEDSSTLARRPSTSHSNLWASPPSPLVLPPTSCHSLWYLVLIELMGFDLSSP